MNNLFAFFYEILNGIWIEDYDFIFKHIYDSDAYASMGWFLILIPLVMLAIFYFLWRYPYGRIWHWLLWILVIGLVTAVVTYFYSDNMLADYLATAETEMYSKGLLRKYALTNLIYATLLGGIHSLWISRFSKIQMHLPF